ncbi:MAG: HPF/RaiA family ribosome-associated protein [Proteobacteria bacterium]|nr:HPF/RaiA family ribosome-associated protein [Pseudomonadota bacterium]
MSVPLQVTFRDMEPSPAIESAIREKVAKLGQYYSRIQRCRVMVECPHKHHKTGAEYHIRIDVTVPGSELVVAHQGGGEPGHGDVYVALRDAFRAARRELQEYVGRLRDQVKRGDMV